MARPTPSSWRMIPRPLLETILNNHGDHHRVPQPLLLHGPRGSGKSSLLTRRILPKWSSPPHFTAFVDLNPDPPWTLTSSSSPPPLPHLKSLIHSSLESLALSAIKIGAVSSRDIYKTLAKRHAPSTALRRLTGREGVADSKLWHRVVFDRVGTVEIGDDAEVAVVVGGSQRTYAVEEAAFVKEGVAALGVAKEVIEMQQGWRREAVRRMNAKGIFSRSLVDSATDWPVLLVALLSQAAEVGFFQPKLVMNNIDVLRKAITTDDVTVPAPMYHDSLLWRLISLGVNERCLPVILITSDSYYSYQALVDFGFPDIFISRETFGWTVQEAKLHMVSDYFSEPEWKVIDEVLGPNPRHLSELYTLKQSADYQDIVQDISSFEGIVDAYLAYLQITVVNPAMESALSILQKFASDVRAGKIPEGCLYFGAPWRHPPRKDDPVALLKWAKIQLMDFVQALVNTEFGVNYLADYSLELLEDPSAVAMMEVGLLYVQRDPSFIRPITRGIQRCLARWLVQEKMKLTFNDYIPYLWQRTVRGRSYRHLMKEIGYK